MSIVVPARIHRQNSEGYCGAASAQMALAALGMDPRQLAQKQLYTASHEEPWFSRPDLLTRTLNDRWQNRKNLRFRLYRCADIAGMVGVMRRMFEQFGGEGAVAIALTMHTNHWVVVRGFETHPDDPSQLIGFHVRNPMPSIELNPEDKEHAEDDDCCGADGGKCRTCHYMSLARWYRDVAPVKWDGPWKNEYLVICLDRVGQDLNDDVTVSPVADTSAERVTPTGPILSAQELEARVREVIADNPFLGEECLTKPLTTTRAATPILVEGLNPDGSTNREDAYYLVPFVDPNGAGGDPGSVPLAMTVNAVTGEFEEAIAMPDGSIYDPASITPGGLEQQALGNNLDRLRRRSEPGAVFPHVAVWRHSEQTPTRFLPVFVGERTVMTATPEGLDRDGADDAPTTVIDGGSVERIGTVNTTVFMRIDGKIITDLGDTHP